MSGVKSLDRTQRVVGATEFPVRVRENEGRPLGGGFELDELLSAGQRFIEEPVVQSEMLASWTRSRSSAACVRLRTPRLVMMRRSVSTNHFALHGIHCTRSQSVSNANTARKTTMSAGWIGVKYSASTNKRMSMITSGSHRNSGRVAMITFSFGSRMTSRGPIAREF